MAYDFANEKAIIDAQDLQLKQLTALIGDLYEGAQNQLRNVDAYSARIVAAAKVLGVNEDGTTTPVVTTPTDPNAEPSMTMAVYTNGNFDATKYIALAKAAGTEPALDYRFGPSAAYYGADKEQMPTLVKRQDLSLDVISEAQNPGVYASRPCRPGQCGTYQIGSPKPGQAGNYSSNYGQCVFVPDNRQAGRNQGGIGVAGILAWNCGYDTASTRPELAWWAQLYDGGGLDDIYQLYYRDQGQKIEYPTCATRGDGRFGNGTGVIVCYRDGRVTHSGQNTASNKASIQLPSGLTPIAITVTNSHEFAFILVMDTNTGVNRTRIAIVALAGTPQNGYQGNEANWEGYRGEWRSILPGVGSYGNIAWMKYMGLVDLPADMRCATEIASSTYWWEGAYQRMQDMVDGEKGSDLRQASRRIEFRDGGSRAGIFPVGCTVVVISKEEKKAVFLDFSKLFQFIKASTLNEPGLQNIGLGAGQYPPTVTENTSILPTILRQETFAFRPTAIRLSQVDINRRIYLTTQDGTLHIYSGGPDRTPTNSTVTKITTTFVGKNPTDITTTARHAGNKLLPNGQQSLEIIITCRGERKIKWMRLSSDFNAASIIRVLCDSRLVDPIAARDGPNHTTEHYLLTVSDYGGKQLVNFRYGPIIFHWFSGTMGDGGSNLVFDWKTSLPPDGTPVTPTVFNGVTYPFEHAGQFSLPGRPWGYYPSDVF